MCVRTNSCGGWTEGGQWNPCGWQETRRNNSYFGKPNPFVHVTVFYPFFSLCCPLVFPPIHCNIPCLWQQKPSLIHPELQIPHSCSKLNTGLSLQVLTGLKTICMKPHGPPGWGWCLVDPPSRPQMCCVIAWTGPVGGQQEGKRESLKLCRAFQTQRPLKQMTALNTPPSTSTHPFTH